MRLSGTESQGIATTLGILKVFHASLLPHNTEQCHKRFIVQMHLFPHKTQCCRKNLIVQITHLSVVPLNGKLLLIPTPVKFQLSFTIHKYNYIQLTYKLCITKQLCMFCLVQLVGSSIYWCTPGITRLLKLTGVSEGLLPFQQPRSRWFLPKQNC